MLESTTLLAVVLSLAAIALGYFALFKTASGPRSALALAGTEFAQYPLIQKVVLSHNTAVFRFGLARPNDVLGLPIGQHIQIQAQIGGKNILRSYTPTSIDHDSKGFFDLLIKVYEQGNISKYIDNLKLGDKITVKGPRGHFNYQPNKWSHLCMVAGGTGITPMFQIMKSICVTEGDNTKVTLLYGSVTEEDILLKQELDALVQQNPNIQVHYYLNEAPEGWQGGVGFINGDVIKEKFPAPADDTKLLLCGPPPMVSSLKKASNELGWQKAKPVSKADDQVFVF